MTKTDIKRLALGLLASGAMLAIAAPASANSAEYFAMRAVQSDVPALLPQSDREYYKAVFDAIGKADWAKVQELFAQRPDGPLHKVALAQYYLDPKSPRIELPLIEAWLKTGTELPQAERLTQLGLKRGLTNRPSLPNARSLYRQSSPTKRIRPSSIDDGTMPGNVRDRILDRIKYDDPDGAREALASIDTQLSPEARAEWRQRVAWSYYIENKDNEALTLALAVEEAGAGPWVAEGNWVAGLAAWRINDCVNSLAGFERAAINSTNPELTAAAHYWANRSAVRCRMPERAAGHLADAAKLDETMYGMLAAEQLGIALPDRYGNADFADADWRRLQNKENVRIAVELAEIGQEDLASEFLIHQARIGDPSDYEALSRLARGLGLPSTQLYMANYAPAGGKADPASSYPAPKWMPATGWAIDPALAFAHTLQESNFRTTAVSPAAAKGLMQITPITVREHAPRLQMNASAVDLTDPGTNLAFGQRNLEMLRDSQITGGKLPKIMAAYNAGLAPVTRWNDEVRDGNDPLLYIESIPYWETRGYVAIVMRNYWMYERQAKSPSPSRLALASGAWPEFPAAPPSGRVWLGARAGD